jgi:hypothetical protein
MTVLANITGLCCRFPTFLISYPIERSDFSTEGRSMKRIVLSVIFVLLVGATASTVYGESPIIITPSNWYTGFLENGTSESTSFAVQNGGPVDLMIRNISLKTTSSSFSIVPATPLPATLSPAGEIQVEITFTASGHGVHQATIEVDYIKAVP